MKRTLLKTVFAVAACATVSACAVPGPVHNERRLTAMSLASLCGVFGRGHYAPADHDLAVGRLRAAGFNTREIAHIQDQTIYLGMSKGAAVCSWGAVKVGTMSGYGSYSEQFKSDGGSYFFTNGRDRVDFIST